MPEFDGCLRQVMAIRGALGACLIDHFSGLTVASTGRSPGDPMSPFAVARAAVESPALAPLAAPGHLEDIVITAANGYHLMHFLAAGFDARLVLYAWLDRRVGNLAMTQLSLHAIGRDLVAG